MIFSKRVHANGGIHQLSGQIRYTARQYISHLRKKIEIEVQSVRRILEKCDYWNDKNYDITSIHFVKWYVTQYSYQSLLYLIHFLLFNCPVQTIRCASVFNTTRFWFLKMHRYFHSPWGSTLCGEAVKHPGQAGIPYVNR